MDFCRLIKAISHRPVSSLKLGGIDLWQPVKAISHRPVSSLKYEKTSFHYQGAKVFSSLEQVLIECTAR